MTELEALQEQVERLVAELAELREKRAIDVALEICPECVMVKALEKIRTTEDLEEICAIVRDALKGGE